MDRHPKRRAQMSFKKNEQGQREESEPKPSTSRRVCSDCGRGPGRPPKVPTVIIDRSEDKTVEERQVGKNVNRNSSVDSKKHHGPVIFKAVSSKDTVPTTLLQEAEELDSSTLPKESLNVNDNVGQNILFLTPVFTNSTEVQSVQEESNANANNDDSKIDFNVTPQIAEAFSISTQNLGQDQPQVPGDLSTQILQSNDYQIQYTIEGAEPIILSRVPFPPPPLGLPSESSVRIDTSGVNLTQSPSTAGK